MARLVKCTVKGEGRDPYTTVIAIGGRDLNGGRWTQSLKAAIEEIETGAQTYYVNVNGFTPNLVVAVHAGIKYLKAPFDPDVPATLLGLPDCPDA